MLWPRFLVLAIGLVLVVQALSAAFGIHPAHSFWGDIQRNTGVLFLIHLGVLALIAGEFFTKRDWSLVRRSVLLSAAAFALITMLGAGGLGIAEKFLWLDMSMLGVSFGNDTFAGLYMVLAFGLGLIELIRSKSKWRFVILAALALVVLSPILTDFESILGSARASSIALFFLIAVTVAGYAITKLLKGRALSLTTALLVSGGAIAVIALPSLLMLPGSVAQQHVRDDTTESRFIIWEGAPEMVMERGLLGWGPENFDRAFESHFDARLYRKEGLLEVWFDRAHNVFVDTLVTSGVGGIIAFVLLIGAYTYAVVGAMRFNAIGRLEMVVLISLPLAHLIQLQTSFDTIPSYALLALLGGYVLSLERECARREVMLSGKYAAIVLTAFALLSLAFVTLKEYSRQVSLVTSLSEEGAALRQDLIKQSLTRTSDFEGLHRSANLFIESVIARAADSKNPNAVHEEALPYLSLYIDAYARYLEVEPEHYRARMNYAYILLLESEWGGVRADKAVEVIESSYALSPDNPLTYVLHAIGLVYIGDYKAARNRVEAAKNAYPTVEIVRDAGDWLERQVRQSPERTFLFIANI